MKLVVSLLVGIFSLSMSAQTYQMSEVDTAPIFAKGKMSSSEFLRYYQEYPEEARSAGIQGKVVLEYIVDETGMITNAKVLRSVNAALDNEALRLTSLMPFYTPAKKDNANVAVTVLFQVPFVLDSNTTTPITDKQNDEPKNPLYVVNSKILEEDSNIDPEDILKIRIIKGKKAIELYGERARDGVIMIELK